MTQRYFFRFPLDLFQDTWISQAVRDTDLLWANFNPSYPPTDTLVDKKTGELRFEMAVAGYDPESISITTDDNCIIVESSGYKLDGEQFEIVGKGIKSSGFRQKIPLSSKYDLSKIEVKYSNGLLILKIPIAEEKKPKKINITK